MLLPFMCVDVLGWSIAPKKSALSVLHELAESVQKKYLHFKVGLHACEISLSKSFSLQR